MRIILSTSTARGPLRPMGDEESSESEIQPGPRGRHLKKLIGAITPSTPLGPQRDAGIQCGPRRDDIDELDAAVPGWGPQNRRYSYGEEKEFETSSMQEVNR